MKLSLAWIFEHIVPNATMPSARDVVAAINRSTAEAEIAHEISIDKTIIRPVRITAITDAVVAEDLESGTSFKLPLRNDAFIGGLYAIVLNNNKTDWLPLSFVGSAKDKFFPRLHVTGIEHFWHGVAMRDVIIEIDNKSITHRPDLWCHRGFAREVAAIFGLQMRPLEPMLAALNVERQNDLSYKGSFSVDTLPHTALKKIAVLEVPHVTMLPSTFDIAVRLAAVDSTPFNMVVDLTNYVTFDIGQPMHSFDRAAFENAMTIRTAHDGEKLVLLDGNTYELSSKDTVIANEQGAVSLAGIKGGAHSGVQDDTKALLIESAVFDASMIRLSAVRAKIRTESSARYEKSLDPENAEQAVKRYVKLLQDYNVEHTVKQPLLVLGPTPAILRITLEHQFIETRLGIVIEKAFVVDALQRLGFAVQAEGESYVVQIPSFRATKDVTRPEDIVEEVGRLYGYDRIEPVVPTRHMRPFSTRNIRLRRMVEDVSAFGMRMHQVTNYPFFDEELLARFKWEPGISIRAKHPMSVNLTRLVTSLIPHLIKGASKQPHHVEQVGYFEINKTWGMYEQEVVERQTVAYLRWTKCALNFYQAKNDLAHLEKALGVTFDYRKEDALQFQPWFDRHQTADIYCGKVQVGTLGMLSPAFYGDLLGGNVWAAEFDYEQLIGQYTDARTYVAPSKFPLSWFDISLLIPASQTVESYERLLKSVDARITRVELHDFYENPEWQDKRSMTLRFFVQDPERTLVKEDIDLIWDNVQKAVKAHGAQVR